MKLAATVEEVIGTLNPPAPVNSIGNGAQGINRILDTAVELIFMVAAVIVVFMFLYAAIEFITSAGDKDKVASARKRITFSVIGITILALTFLLLRVLGGILGINFFTP